MKKILANCVSLLLCWTNNSQFHSMGTKLKEEWKKKTIMTSFNVESHIEKEKHKKNNIKIELK